MTVEILRYTAFTTDPSGGNPAGVVLDAGPSSDREMLNAAADLGFSETAFLLPRGAGVFDIRYFSPQDEVPFCGHATVATAVAYAERYGPGAMVLNTLAGAVDVITSLVDGRLSATFTTVEPRTAALPSADLLGLLRILGWAQEDLDPALPARVAFAGAWHPILAVRTRKRLAALSYDFGGLAQLMARRGWTTIDLLWRESETTFHARNPFPPGGIIEDPATGAAAGAFGGYLRELGLTPVPGSILIHQGDDLGRPSVLRVDIPTSGGIRVSGTAVAISQL